MAEELTRGRDAFDRWAWARAYEQLSAAADGLEVADLERLAQAAYLVGRRGESIEAWTRAHQDYLRRNEVPRAARCGFWLAVGHLYNGEPAQGSGWIDRVRRLLDQHGIECVEQGYLRFAAGLRSTFSGDVEAGYAGFSDAADLGERFADPQLVAQARVGQGRCLIYLGRIAEGVGLLDEAMVAVSAREVSPMATGDVYCTAIEGYQEVLDVPRVREWTEALSRWCEAQPELVLYRGQCLLHRAELLALQGAWTEAVTEAQRACDRLAHPFHPAVAAATYLRAELHRLRGEADAAEAAFGDAADLGREPQPGLALLRLAQGHAEAAETAIRRAWAQAEDPFSRTRIAAPFTEIVLSAGDVAAARAAADVLCDLPADLDGLFLRALRAQVTGAVLLAEGDPPGAQAALRAALHAWQALGAPYEAARTRVLIGTACRASGDDDGAVAEAQAARAVFVSLGAAPDVPRAEALLAPRSRAHPGGLTDREVEVIVLVAAARTNRDIARELGISEKTVASHLNHVFTKLGLPSRAAATAFAYEHGLVK